MTKCISPNFNSYTFDESGKEIRCTCPRCSRWNHIFSEDREYDGDLDGKDGLLDYLRQVQKESDDVADEYQKAEELRKDYELLRKIT